MLLLLSSRSRICSALFICSCIYKCLSFNLDTFDPMIFNPGKQGYYFGYSIALHRHKGNNWLIVGAPLGNDTSQGYRPNYGTVYKCDLSTNNRLCSVMENFDRASSDIRQVDGMGDDFYKTGQWMGGTVRSKRNFIMACAPRFAWPGTSEKKHYLPVGKCEVVDTENESKTWLWEPCRKVQQSQEQRFGFCNFGLDANFNSKAGAVVGGGPTLGSSKGRLIASNLFSSNAYFSSKAGINFDQTGYAVIFCKLGSKGQEVLIGGAPTGDSMRGQVIIYKMLITLPVLMILTNPTKQIGSYFGSSLAAADVNGDGYQDLLIGAPYYYTSAEEGVVFVYINNKKDNLDLSSTFLYGEGTTRARFGTSIANAGDLNNDGYEDIAVGAPYGGVDSKGIIYIYEGSRNGIQSQFSQKIMPSHFGLLGLSLSAFGSSLSGGVDIDGNGYPDLAVGSFLSDNALVLRARPVVNIKGKVELQYAQINPNSTKQSCIGHDGAKHLCLPTWVCFKVGGKGVPLPIGLSYEYIIDEQEPIHKRGIFVQNSVPTYRISRAIQIRDSSCIKHIAYLNMQPHNIEDPLVFKVFFNYIPPTGCKFCPTMNPGSSESMATYAKNCGSDSICVADIKIKAEVRLPGGQKEIHVGVTKTLTLWISLKNFAENAFLTRISAFIPVQLSVNGVHLKNTSVSWKLDYYNDTHNRLDFDAGNPISYMAEEHIDVRFTIKTISTTIQSLHFEVNATTSSKEKRKEDNQAMVKVNVVVIADMTISGAATPDQITYNESRSAKEVGPFILHSFLVQNKGPSTVDRSRVDIHFPVKLQEDFLLNLISITVDGSVHCHINKSSYNPLGLELGAPSPATNEIPSRRKRRSVKQKLDCKTGHCQVFSCELGRLRRGESVTIIINSSLVESTFAKKIEKGAFIAVRAVVIPDSIRQPHFNFPDISVPVLEILSPRTFSEKEKKIPWWIILISVIAGLVLVAGVVFVLHKSGFFNRKKKDYSFSSVSDEPKD